MNQRSYPPRRKRPHDPVYLTGEVAAPGGSGELFSFISPIEGKLTKITLEIGGTAAAPDDIVQIVVLTSKDMGDYDELGQISFDATAGQHDYFFDFQIREVSNIDISCGNFGTSLPTDIVIAVTVQP